jgi:hypothetical protein
MRFLGLLLSAVVVEIRAIFGGEESAHNMAAGIEGRSRCWAITLVQPDTLNVSVLNGGQERQLHGALHSRPSSL